MSEIKDENLIMKDMLNEEFDAADLFVSEDLIARTMAAIKGLEEEKDVESEETVSRVMSIAEAGKKVADNHEDRDTEEVQPVQKKRSFKWVKWVSGIAAALLVGVIGFAALTNNDYEMMKNSSDNCRPAAASNESLALSFSTNSSAASEKKDSMDYYEEIASVPTCDITTAPASIKDESAAYSDAAPDYEASAYESEDGRDYEFPISLDINDADINDPQYFIAPSSGAKKDVHAYLKSVMEKDDSNNSIPFAELEPDQMQAILEVLGIKEGQTGKAETDDAEEFPERSGNEIMTLGAEDNDMYHYIAIYDSAVYYELRGEDTGVLQKKWLEFSNDGPSPMEILEEHFDSDDIGE